MGQHRDKISLQYFNTKTLMSLLSLLSFNNNIYKENETHFYFSIIISVFPMNMGHRAKRNFIQLYRIDGHGTEHRPDGTAKGTI